LSPQILEGKIAFPLAGIRELKAKQLRELEVPTLVVKPHGRFIEAWVDCAICDERIRVKINKKDFVKGLQTGIYVHYHGHTNPRPPPDPNHPSLQKHTAAVYIDKDYNIKGVKCFMGTEISSKEVGAAGARIPVVVKKISSTPNGH
jgi:hypothetical protein